MSIDVTLRDIQSGYLTATAFTENNTLIEQALAKAIDRNGGVNNEMLADLDMGLNNIINVNDIDVNSVTIDGTDYAVALQAIADDAQNSADASSTSAGESAQSASDAADSLALVQTLSDQFRGTYYGEAASDPILDPLGNPVTPGDLYYNTTDNKLYVYNGNTESWAPVEDSFTVDADQVAYDNTASGLSATNAQTAIDENAEDINQRVIYVGSVAAMRALTGLLDGQAINLTAYRSGWAATVAGPKGGGQFVVDTSDTTTVDDGGTTFVTSGGVRIKRKDYQSITFEMFGAYGDGTNNDQPFMQAAIDSKAAERFPIIMDDAVYGVESQVSGRSGISILGSSPSDSIIKALTGFAGGGSILRFNAADSFITGVTCQDFRIDCNNQAAHGFEMVRAYDANKVSNVWSINTADAHSSFRFVGLTDAGPVDIGQTLLCERLYAGHANATATSPTIFLERLQESVFIECKAWGVLSGSKAPANPWVLQDCRSVTLVQPSATSTTGFGIRVLTSTKDSSGIAIISPLYENVDDLLETLDVGGFSIVGLSHTSPRFQSPIDAAAEFLLQDCNSCTLETLSQNVTIGATCVATEIKTVDSTKVTNGSSTSTIIQRSNATNLRQKIITEGGISVLNSDESVEMFRTSVPGSGVVGVLLAVNRAGTTTLDTVTIGSPDSGGSGFRVLRVAN